MLITKVSLVITLSCALQIFLRPIEGQDCDFGLEPNSVEPQPINHGKYNYQKEINSAILQSLSKYGYNQDSDYYVNKNKYEKYPSFNYSPKQNSIPEEGGYDANINYKSESKESHEDPSMTRDIKENNEEGRKSRKSEESPQKSQQGDKQHEVNSTLADSTTKTNTDGKSAKQPNQDNKEEHEAETTSKTTKGDNTGKEVEQNDKEENSQQVSVEEENGNGQEMEKAKASEEKSMSGGDSSASKGTMFDAGKTLNDQNHPSMDDSDITSQSYSQEKSSGPNTIKQDDIDLSDKSSQHTGMPNLNTGGTKNYYKDQSSYGCSSNQRVYSRPSRIKNFVGSNLFDGNRKECFSVEDVTVLSIRRDFELLIPKDLPEHLFTDRLVNLLMQYFFCGHYMIQRSEESPSKRLLEKAYYDMLGGYLHYYVVPVTKFSFYAGQVEFKTVDNILELYSQCKAFLNTNGNGWREPIHNPLHELKQARVEPMSLYLASKSSKSDVGCCAELDLSSVNNDVEDEQMIVSLPKLDSEDRNGHLGNIWLPFKRKKTYDLRSCKSNMVVMKFFKTVTCCYGFENMCQDTYNQRMKDWIAENILEHLSDEQFYPGLGGVLRIYEAVKRSPKKPNCGISCDVCRNQRDENEVDVADTEVLNPESLEEPECENVDDENENKRNTDADGGESDDLQYNNLKMGEDENDDPWVGNYVGKVGKPFGKKKCFKKPSTPRTPCPIEDFQKDALKYCLCALTAALGIAVMVAMVMLMSWCFKSVYCFYKRSQSKKPVRESEQQGKCKRLCNRLWCKKKRTDDVPSSQPKRTSYKLLSEYDSATCASSSSLACQPTRCIPVPSIQRRSRSKSKSKRESTDKKKFSRSYSSSDTEDKHHKLCKKISKHKQEPAKPKKTFECAELWKRNKKEEKKTKPAPRTPATSTYTSSCEVSSSPSPERKSNHKHEQKHEQKYEQKYEHKHDKSKKCKSHQRRHASSEKRAKETKSSYGRQKDDPRCYAGAEVTAKRNDVQGNECKKANSSWETFSE